MKLSPKRRGSDFYPTPEWATQGLLANEVFTGQIWECACGDGAMAEVLRRTGYLVLASDLHHRGYGYGGIDFLTYQLRSANIVTNPPYYLANQFVAKALECADYKVAMLLRLAFLEGVARYHSLFAVNPPSRVWVFSERVTMYPRNAVVAGSSTTAYAWFVWEKGCGSGPTIGWVRPGSRK
jgi:hypothetical protein